MLKILLLTLFSFAATLSDKDYFKELEIKIQAIKEPQKNIASNYVEYLKTGNDQNAQNYIQELKKSANKNTSFSIFEGDFEFCHLENNACTRGIGELTQTYLIPKLKKGDKTALELLFAYTALVKTDGADSEELAHTLKKLNLKKLHKSFFDTLRKDYSPNKWL
jgi:hypothetical protein